MSKRFIDGLVSSLVLLLLSPLFVAATVVVWLGSGRPVLFRQQRVGKNFRRFDILKFRSMRTGTDGSSVTVGGDERITRVGKFLRATKLDELPQFWNVFCGHMSIVGPRPELPEYVEMFEARYRHILSVRPGITDLASIYFRDEEIVLAGNKDPLTYYREHVLPMKLDLADQYIRNGGLMLDFAIMLRTARIAVFPSKTTMKHSPHGDHSG